MCEVIELPFVQVNVWSGMTLENKKKIVEGITRVFEEISIPHDATTGIICEKPKENWASGSKLLSERYVNRGP